MNDSEANTPDNTATQPSTLYGKGARALQDEFDSRRLADRLADLTLHNALTEEDVELITAQSRYGWQLSIRMAGRTFPIKVAT